MSTPEEVNRKINDWFYREDKARPWRLTARGVLLPMIVWMVSYVFTGAEEFAILGSVCGLISIVCVLVAGWILRHKDES